MKDNVLVTYERKSTLWKNANYRYKICDWVKMECIFRDFSDFRTDDSFELINNKTGEILDKNDVYCDLYVIRLTSSNGNVKAFKFKSKDDANNAFLNIINDKTFGGWRKR